MEKKLFVLSLGGSFLVPDGPDYKMVRQYAQLLEKMSKKGIGFAVVVGGGSTARLYQRALKSACPGVKKYQLDLVGIAATHLNANLFRNALSKNTKISVFGGTKPGWSTDYVAVQLARKLKAKSVINLTDLYYVYTADPKKDRNAKILKKLSWKEFRGIVGGKWTPGAKLPFDPIACRAAEKLGISVIISNGMDLDNLSKILSGKKSKATIIQ